MFSLRLCLHPLRRHPVVSLVIVLSLAVGIAANTLVFSWLRHARFDPLPGAASAGVMSLETIDDTGNYVATSWLEYLDLAGRTPSLAGIAAQRMKSLRVGEPGADTRVAAQYVSGNFFDVLGVRVRLGRTFQLEDATAAAAPVAVVSFDYWLRALGGRDDAVGATIKLNDVPCTIVGVAPPEFRGGYNALSFDVWVPAVFATRFQPSSTELTHRKARAYTLLARLAPGATRAAIQGELDAAARWLLDTYPETNRGQAYALLPLWRSPRGGRTMVNALATLQCFTILILLVVCTNTASLLLARASDRRREMAVRLALGAAPRHLFALLLQESLAVAGLAAGAGLLLTTWGASWLDHLALHLPGNLPLHLATDLDASAIVFGCALAIVCSLVFGLAPMLQLLRANSTDALAGGRGTVAGRRATRDFLIAAEVAVALVVLVLAAGFARSFRTALHTNPGFDVDHTLLASVDLAGRNYDTRHALAFYDRILPALRSQPGVLGASAASDVLLDLHGLSTGVIDVAGKPFDPRRKVLYSYATPGHFATLGLGFREGSDFTPLGRTDLPVDAVINVEMARRFWPEASPVGRHFTINDTDYVISGVVADCRYESLTEPPQPAVWLTMRSRFVGYPTLHVRAGGDPLAALDAVRAALKADDPGLVVLQPRRFAEHVSANLILQRVPAQFLAVLAPLALLVAAFGIYAVLAHNFAQRTPEIGVRLALGAEPGQLVGALAWQGFRVVLAGAFAGWLVALGLGRLLQPVWVRVPLHDPAVFGAVPLIVVAVAWFACWLPAHRCSRVDPTAALRTG